MSTRPPRIARILASALLPASEREYVLGDMDELFERDANLGNTRQAHAAYWRQTFALLRHRIPNQQNPAHLAHLAHPAHLVNIMPMSDLIIAARTAWQSRGYSAITVLTLALAIGANTLLFSIASPLLVRPLPIAEPNGLGWIQMVNAPRQIDRGSLSVPDFLEIRDRAKSFSSLAGYETASATLSGHQPDPERVQIIRGTSNFTDVWGMKPSIGRLFSARDVEPGQPGAAVLSTRYWRERFAADPHVLGKQFLLNNTPIVVVGVMAPEMEIGNLVLIDIWMPVEFNPNAPRDARSLRVLGRLAPGATLASANAEVSAIATQQAKDHPTTNQDFGAKVVSTQVAITSGDTWVILLLLAIVVGFVLLIACANLANLVMARLTARRVDLAVRQALGASRWQLIRPLLMESLLLSVTGGAIGLVLAIGGLRVINAVAYEAYFKTIGIDGYVLAFAAFVSCVTPAIFCLWPALSAGRHVSAETLRDSRTSGGRSVRRRRNVLVAGQVALALSLLVVSTLAVRSMLYLRHIDTGLDINAMASFRFELPADRYADDGARVRFGQALAERLSRVPGATHAAVASRLPVFDREETRQIAGLSLGTRDIDQPWAAWYSVTPDYFQTAGVALLTGRGFSDAAATQQVAIVNRHAAEKYFGGVQNAIGRQVELVSGTSERRAVTVVGVSADTTSPIITVTSPQVYVPMAQAPVATMVALVRSNTPDRQAADLRAAMRELDAQVPVAELRTVRDIEQDENSSTGIINGLFVAFAMLALVLAAGGLYGVISYSVGQRSREIGVRMALGAAPSGIRQLVLADGFKVTLAGVGVGLVLGVLIARLASPILFGVSATDPVTFVAVTAMVLLVSVASILAPAMRAMRVDPAKTLRNS